LVPEDFDYQGTYAAMKDEELLAIAADCENLEPAARVALQEELDKRELKPESSTAAAIDEPDPPIIHELDPPVICPGCHREVSNHLTCGACATLICHACGTPLRVEDELE